MEGRGGLLANLWGVFKQLENGRVQHRFEVFMLGLALLVVPVVLLDISTHEGTPWKQLANIGNWVIWAGFTVEIIGIVAVAPRKRAALRAHWLDLAIVVLSFPVLGGLLASARLVRLFRFMRLVRLAMIATRALALDRKLGSRHGFRYVAMATVFLVVVAGIAMNIADDRDFPNVWVGIWWAVVTVTTVGYGDYSPHTVAGRILAGALMLVGIGFLSTLTATIASSFVYRDSETVEGAEQSTNELVLASLQRIEARLDVLETKLTPDT